MGPRPTLPPKRRLAIAALVAATLTLPTLAHAATAAPTGTLSKQKPLGLGGVSPFAERQADGSVRLYYASEGGTAMDQCTLAGTCTRVGVIAFRTDITILTLPDGTRRAYFKEINPTAQTQELASATIAADGLTLGASTPTGFSVPMAKKAWGVPDAVLLPNGRVRLYWTDSGSGPEYTRSATATDATGTTFAADPGKRTTGGIVDFEVLQAKNGAWLAIASTTPGNPPQRLLVGRSTDGLKWTFGTKPVSSLKINALDPTGFSAGKKNTFHLYYTTSPKANPFDGFAITQATLTIN